MHQEELRSNWDSLRSSGEFRRIEPLVWGIDVLKIEQARYLGDHRFELRFDDGRSGTIDVRCLASDGPGTVFAPLHDEAFARRFELRYGTLSWPGELDVAPEYLYFLAFRSDPELQERFERWGYLPQPAQV